MDSRYSILAHDGSTLFYVTSAKIYSGKDVRFYKNNSSVILCYVLSGSLIIESPEFMLKKEAGCVIIISHSVECILYSASEDLSCIIIEPNGKIFAQLSDTLFKNQVSSSYMPLFDTLIETVDMFSRYNAGDKNAALEICNRVFDIFIKCYINDSPPSKKCTAEDIKAYLDINICNNISLSDIGKHFGLTGIHIIRIFKEKYDDTPVQYLKNSRLKYSVKLLTKTDINVKSIAKIMCYNSSQHFSNLFRETYGYAPGKYRELYKKKNR